MAANTLESHLERQRTRSQGFFWNRLRWELVASRLPEGEAAGLVDVGAGPGFLGDFLEQRFPLLQYRYIEPLEGLEADLEARFGAEANLRQSESFEGSRYVTLLDVLEHQEDDRGFMRELSEKMPPGALLLLTVPAMPSLWSDWDVLLGHYRRYTKDSLGEVVADLPFEIEEVSYLFPELLPMGWIRRLRRSAGDSSGTEFPDLPRWLNETLYRIGKPSLAQRRRWPAGTSVFAALRRSA